MSETDLILCCYEGKAVYIPLVKDLPVAIGTAIEALETIRAPLTRHLRDHANLYMSINGRKVYFVCLSDCGRNNKCVCGWTTVKTKDVVFLESKHRWYVRLWLRITDVFI